MNLVFIGIGGAGKSAFAAYCSALLNMPLIDTDAEIEKKFGDISSIFSNNGEAFFRAAEEKELIDLSEKDNCCAATGGGAVLSEAGMRAVKKSGLVVYLKCNAETICERIKADFRNPEKPTVRPLFARYMDSDEKLMAKIEEMLGERAELYEKYADIVICEDEVLKSRGIFGDELSVQLGAIYIELVRALEKKVDDDRRKYART